MKNKIIAEFFLKWDRFSFDVKLEIPMRGITGVFGDSGCGKTTLLRCLAGLERADSGLLKLNGAVWQDTEQGVFIPPYERPIGVVFQEARLFPHLTVLKNLQYGMRRKQVDTDTEIFDHIVSLLGISHLLDRKPAGLSGGEQQRISIGRALLTNPKLLLMDEPLASLDRKRKAEIMPFLDRLHEELEIPILYVSHSIEEIEHLADHLILMEEGKVVECGPIDSVNYQSDLYTIP